MVSPTLPKIEAVRLGTVATLGMLCGTLLQFSIAALAPFIVEDLSIPRANFGFVLAVLFAVSALASGVAGRLVDRYPLRWELPVFFLLCAAVLLVAGIPAGYKMLLVAAALGGVLLALSNPLTNRLLSQEANGAALGMTIGIKQSGGQIGAVIAGLVMPSLATSFGWRVAVTSGASIALLSMISTRFLKFEFSKQISQIEGEGSTGRTATDSTWPLAWYALFMGSAHAIFVGYLTLFAFDSVGSSPRRAGAVTAVLGVAALVGRIAWGTIAADSDRHRRAFMIVPLLTIGGLVCVVVSPMNELLLLIGAIIVGSTGLAWSALITTAVIFTSDEGNTGRVSASVFRPAFISFAVAPPAFGALVDVLDSYTVGWFFVGLALVAASISSTALPKENASLHQNSPGAT